MTTRRGFNASNRIDVRRLHPFLALWAVLLGLSSLARYEPATWSKMIDIDKSAEANAAENLLDEAIGSVSEAALHLLAGLQ